MNYKSLSRKKEYYTRVGCFFFPSLADYKYLRRYIFIYVCVCVYIFKNKKRFMKYKAKV